MVFSKKREEGEQSLIDATLSHVAHIVAMFTILREHSQLCGNIPWTTVITMDARNKLLEST